MTGSSDNTGRVQWLTFFGVEHVEGGEGGVYPFHRLCHLSLGQFEKMSPQTASRPFSITPNKLK